MALFKRKSSDVATLERELSDLTSRREVLEQKFDWAHAALAAARDQRRTVLLETDMTDELAVKHRDENVRTAADQVEALADALAAIGIKIGDATTKLAELHDRAEREQVARQATAEVEALTSVLEGFREISARLTAAIEPLATRISSAADFLPRTQLLLSDIATVSAAPRRGRAQLRRSHRIR
jgi:chromosome segregation ATPase